jgi:hypothetical protein
VEGRGLGHASGALGEADECNGTIKQKSRCPYHSRMMYQRVSGFVRVQEWVGDCVDGRFGVIGWEYEWTGY